MMDYGPCDLDVHTVTHMYVHILYIWLPVGRTSKATDRLMKAYSWVPTCVCVRCTTLLLVCGQSPYKAITSKKYPRRWRTSELEFCVFDNLGVVLTDGSDPITVLVQLVIHPYIVRVSVTIMYMTYIIPGSLEKLVWQLHDLHNLWIWWVSRVFFCSCVTYVGVRGPRLETCYGCWEMREGGGEIRVKLKKRSSWFFPANLWSLSWLSLEGELPVVVALGGFKGGE